MPAREQRRGNDQKDCGNRYHDRRDPIQQRSRGRCGGGRPRPWTDNAKCCDAIAVRGRFDAHADRRAGERSLPCSARVGEVARSPLRRDRRERREREASCVEQSRPRQRVRVRCCRGVELRRHRVESHQPSARVHDDRVHAGQRRRGIGRRRSKRQDARHEIARAGAVPDTTSPPACRSRGDPNDARSRRCGRSTRGSQGRAESRQPHRLAVRRSRATVSSCSARSASAAGGLSSGTRRAKVTLGDSAAITTRPPRIPTREASAHPIPAALRVRRPRRAYPATASRRRLAPPPADRRPAAPRRQRARTRAADRDRARDSAGSTRSTAGSRSRTMEDGVVMRSVVVQLLQFVQGLGVVARGGR